MKKSQPVSVELKCGEVLPEISNYADGSVAPSVRRAMERHIKTCKPCRSVLDGTRNVIKLLGTEHGLPLPADISRRLYTKLDQYLADQTAEVSQTIPAGITDESIPLGSHLIYFWEGEADFARGVRFLFPGLRSADEHCIAFGHDEALAKVQQVLRSNDFNTDQLIKDGRLTVLRRQSPAQGTVSDISAIIQAALRDGTKAIRFLGNLGMGRDPLPAGEDDVVSLENSVTTLLAQVPCVVVCMYDVQTLSGRMLLRGGLETHKLTVCADGIHDNPHYRPDVDPHIVNRVQ